MRSQTERQEESVRRLVETLDQDISRVGSLVTERFTGFEQSLGTVVSRQAESLEKQIATIEASLRDRAAALSGLVQSSDALSSEQIGSLQASIAELQGGSLRRWTESAPPSAMRKPPCPPHEEFGRSLAATALDLTMRMSRDASSIAANLEAQLSDADQRTVARIEDMSGRLARAVDTLENGLAARTDASVEALEGAAAAVERSLAERGAALQQIAVLWIKPLPAARRPSRALRARSMRRSPAAWRRSKQSRLIL